MPEYPAEAPQEKLPQKHLTRLCGSRLLSGDYFIKVKLY